MKFSVGELVYDPRHRKVGMIKTLESLTVSGVPYSREYGIHFFDDSYCAEGNVRLMSIEHADNILEAYENNCSSR